MNKILSFFLLTALSTAACADKTGSVESELKSKIEKAIPGLKVTAVSDSVIPGVFEVDSNNEEMLYVSADGAHFMVGDMYKVADRGLVNITEQRREEKRAELLATLKSSEFISFAPEAPKSRIIVFTDIDCVYCRKLHQEVPDLNALGIQVDYMAYPRAGMGSKSWDKAVSAWCADDRKQALTDAKQGKSIPEKVCDSPVEAQYRLGQRLGVTGTPAILLENGEIIRGYMPADALAKGLGVL